MSKNAKKYICESCDFNTSNLSNYKIHIATAKHRYRTTSSEKNAGKNVCETCDFECSKQSNFHIHLTTTKHKHRTILNKKQAENAENIFTCKNCYKNYNARNSLWYHEKKCFANGIILHTDMNDNNINNDNNDNNDNNIFDYTNHTENIIVSRTNANDINQLTNLVIEVVKNNSDFQKQMFDMCRNMQSTIISNNCNNTTNNTFNLQVFLNEYCKDAMNISEFIDSFDLQVSDLENVGRLGYIEGMSNIIISKINELDVSKRPIHCSDLHLFTFQTPILVLIKYIIHFIIYFKIQECLGILTKIS